MPIPVQRSHYLTADAEFRDGFKRSARGNIWRVYDGVTVSVFQRSDGFFGWSIADGQTVQYSSRTFETESEAMQALTEMLV